MNQIKAEYVDHMGDDLRVVNAARVSFDKESEWKNESPDWMNGPGTQDQRLNEDDQKLIKYLATHGHWTPFSHPQITIRETVPIFVARQRFKHMVGFTYNEVSRRYVSDEPEFFVPDVWRGAPTDGAKQGSSETAVHTIALTVDGDPLDEPIDTAYETYLASSRMLYTSMINGGVAPEQARMMLPQSMFTSYYVTGSLAAWARAYKLRIDAHAQKEIRDLAVQWGDIIDPLFPVSWRELTTTENKG